MLKKLLLLFVFLLSLNSYSQIIFEKGYYIDNTNQRIECQIRNTDSKKNPTQFEYRLNDESDSKTGTLATVKEFGIYKESKYVVSTVNIDRSSATLDNLSKEKEPLFTEEKLFLKILVEGKANLYQYVDANIIRYFYSKENGIIDQLVYKKFLISDTEIGANYKFRQQLLADLKCNSITSNRIEKVDYNKQDLIRIFSDYSACSGVVVTDLAPKKRDIFNLTLRPRVNNSNLAIKNSVTPDFNVDFGSQLGFGFGLEAEFILPFNKNKWSIAVESTYQKYEAKKTTSSTQVAGGAFTTAINYTSIDVPLSLRHYFFLTDNSKLFLNAGIVFDLSSKSNVNFTRADGSLLNSVIIDAKNNFTLGAGYKLYDKFCVEFRFQTRQAVSDYVYWTSRYNTSSLIIGYSVF